MIKDVIGQRYGRLLILDRCGSHETPSGQLKSLVRCRCDCGIEKVLMLADLTSGNTKSCGCHRALLLDRVRIKGIARRRTHGESLCSKDGTPEYQAWANMIQRCTNSKTSRWKHYGGRGIQVCAEWRDSYRAFLAYVGRKPSPNHSLDRYPNPDGNYMPGNVRWATPSEQNSNKSVFRAA